MLQLRITIPEQVSFHFRIAGLATRGLAWLIDQLIQVGGLMVVVIVLASTGAGSMGVSVFIAAKFLLDFGYYSWFELRWAGQTPGKRLFGIRVVPSHGGRLRFADVLARTLFRVVECTLVVPVVAGIVALIDPLRRRLGDLAADTVVARDVKATLSIAESSQRSRVNSYAADPRIRTRVMSRISREERDLMLDLMMRRDHLDTEVREDLFRRAADRFRRRYALPDTDEHLTDEQTVMNIAMLVQEARFTA